jgi:hypothetical protein
VYGFLSVSGHALHCGYEGDMLMWRIGHIGIAKSNGYAVTCRFDKAHCEPTHRTNADDRR